MVEFCPECGNMLRKKACRCGYTQYETTTTKIPLLQLWNPPPPNIIYCKLTATPYETLRSMLKKGNYPAKLKEVKEKLKKKLYSCLDCVYYDETLFLCKFRNKYITKDSICKTFEPFENI
ncbi:MAG: hypothetical protein ACW96S_11580 [Promethearchaeota archaeon]|jgi:hypothetical protein